MLILFVRMQGKARQGLKNLPKKTKKRGREAMKNVKEALKAYILEKVKQETSDNKPYFIVKWSGLAELAKHYRFDLLQIIDEMEEEGLIKKALIPTKKDRKKKLLAIYLPNRIISTKAKKIIQDFESFISKA